MIAETPVKVRKSDGTVKNMKGGGLLVGAPEKVASYLKRFEELPL